MGFQSTLPSRGATRHKHTASRAQTFQSTLPSRGATKTHHKHTHNTQFQSTLPSRGATRSVFEACRKVIDFNPRSPRGERPFLALSASMSSSFQSTLPSRGATRVAGLSISQIKISIHAPLAGSDRSFGYISSKYRTKYI